MIHTVTGWRYWYRIYFGWIPIQFCMVCGRPYWGGLPRWWVIKSWDYVPSKSETKPERRWFYRIGATWMPVWADYCSQKCCDIDGEAIDQFHKK